MELPRTDAGTAPLANFLAIGGVLKDTRVGVSIADENPTFWRKRNIGRPAESAERRCRLPVRVDLKQLFALRTELDDRRTSRIDRPNIALWVEPDRVRNFIHSFTKREQDAAFLVHRYHRIGLVTALNEPRHTGLSVARQPRNHAQLLALG
jgi:hypothetical protein